MPRCIGIDFGTTKSVVSWVNPTTGRAETVRLGVGSDIVPTSVYKDGPNLLFGDDAEDEMLDNPLQYRRNFKLSLGVGAPILRGQVEGRVLDAEALTAFYLRHLREKCSCPGFVDQTPVERAVITYPVTFALHPAKLQALTRAAKDAGFNNIELMCEPEAAGHAFLKEVGNNVNGPILVVDWGGGTLDISILSIDEINQIRCLRQFFKGSDTMGGECIDRLLLDYAKNRYAEEKGAEVDNTLTALPRQLRIVERFKKQLDQKESAKLFLSEGLAGIAISRSELATVIEPFMSDVKQLIYNVLKTAKQEGCTPDRMLLIGGTNRMPYIQDELKQEFGMQTIVWQNSRVAVSLGAAYAADGGAHPAKVKSTSPVKNQRPKKQSAKEKPQSQPQKSKPKTKPNPPKDKGKKWKPGVYHPTIPHIFTSETKGAWDCDPGYVFKKPGYPLEGVKWAAKQTIFNVPNIHSGVKEGSWFPDYGYELKDPNDPFKGAVKIGKAASQRVSVKATTSVKNSRNHSRNVTLDDVRIAFAGLVDNKFHIRGSIPKEKLANARDGMHITERDSKVLCLYDSCAIFTLGDTGWAIVPSGIYIRREWAEPCFFRWREIRTVNVEGNHLEINDYRGPMLWGDNLKKTLVVMSIKYLVKLGTGERCG